jgi:pimeloyl-ACP methyl ester carboxylesterase
MPFYSVNGTSLYFEEHGTGEPLVLVHGAWVDHHSWDAILPLLSRRFRVVVYDLRGHGRSVIDPPDAGDVHDDVSDLVGLIDHLASGPATILGISSGACIVLRTAVEQPRLVRRVLVHEPPYMHLLAGNENAQPYLARAGEVFGDVGALIGARDHAGAARRFWQGLEIGISWEAMSDDMRRSLASHAPAFGGQMNDPDAVVIDVDQLRQLAMPVLVSQGEQTFALARMIVEQLIRIMPGARRVVIPGAGHVPHMTHPERYVAIIEEFVRSYDEKRR